MAALAGEPVDRRPFAGVFSLYGSRLTGMDSRQYYSDPAAYINGQTKVMEQITPDLITTPFTLVAEGEAFGAQIKYLERQPPNFKAPAISSLTEISRLTMPDISTNPRLRYNRACLKELKKRFGNDVMIAAVLLNPCDIPLMISSMEMWLPAVVCQEDTVGELLEKVIPFFLEWTQILVDEGADLIIMPSPFTIPTVVTREIAASYAKPILEKVFSQLDIPLFLHHVGSKHSTKFIDIFADLPHLAGFVVDHRDSLALAREKAGPTNLLLSGLDGPNFDRYSRDEAEKKTLEILSDRSDDPGFIFTLTGPDVSYNASLENLRAVKRVVENYGY